MQNKSYLIDKSGPDSQPSITSNN
uniref:Uncharacterized protein n=1 Tax=Arundo donax TaxID=35708 RepID=A0A0A9BQU3_ARUDO